MQCAWPQNQGTPNLTPQLRSMMKYFILTHTQDGATSGSAYPQVDATYPGEIIRLEIYKYSNRPLPDNTRFPDFKLKYRAKLTDVLTAVSSDSVFNILMSPKCLHVLSQFKLTAYQVFDATVIDKKGNRLPYKMVHSHEPKDNDYVDYALTHYFLVTGHDFSVTPYITIGEDINVNSIEELHGVVHARKRGSVCAKALYLKEDKIAHDAFPLRNPMAWVVNEKVADALIGARITGIALIPLSQGEDFCAESIAIKAQKLAEGERENG